MPRGTRKQHPRESVARGNSLHPIVAPRIHRASGDARPAATRVYRRIARLNRLPSMTQSISEHTTASIISRDRKSTRLNSSHLVISYAVFCLKKKKKTQTCALLDPVVHTTHQLHTKHSDLNNRHYLLLSLYSLTSAICLAAPSRSPASLRCRL